MRSAVKRLSVAGLRGLIREEASKIRRGRGRLRENASITPEIEEAIDALTDAILESSGADLVGGDDMHPEVHNDIVKCVETILSTYDFGGTGVGLPTDDGEFDDIYRGAR